MSEKKPLATLSQYRVTCLPLRKQVRLPGQKTRKRICRPCLAATPSEIKKLTTQEKSAPRGGAFFPLK